MRRRQPHRRVCALFSGVGHPALGLVALAVARQLLPVRNLLVHLDDGAAAAAPSAEKIGDAGSL